MAEQALTDPRDYWRGVDVASAEFANPTRARRARVTAAQALFDAALFAAMSLHRQGLVVDPQRIHEENNDIPEGLAAGLLETDRFRDALTDRGVDIDPVTAGLSGEQLSALAIYLDPGSRLTHAQRLRAIGISEAKWRGWNRQPIFARQIAGLAEELLVDAKPMMLARTVEAIDAGERWAIELGLEMTGRHDRRQQGTDVNALLMAMFAILDESGVSEDVLLKVAQRTRAMLEASRPTPALVPATVVATSRRTEEAP